jgi:hypothetical protein
MRPVGAQYCAPNVFADPSPSGKNAVGNSFANGSAMLTHPTSHELSENIIALLGNVEDPHSASA